MAGTRPLSFGEERALVRAARRRSPRDRALICSQLFLGFRISETLRLTVGHVWTGSAVRAKVGLAPRHLKGGYGSTRWIPVGAELRRALESLLRSHAKVGPLVKTDPLFRSRQGHGRALGGSTAEKLIKDLLLRIAIGDNQALSSHSLRKSFAQRVFHASGHNLLIVQKALGHSSVAITERYLSASEASVEAMIRRGDWSRASRVAPQKVEGCKHVAVVQPEEVKTAMLPGFESLAA